MEKFTHGIMVVNPNNLDENGDIPVLHFVGYWNEPTENDVMSLWDEFNEDDSFALQDQINEIELLPAPEDVIEYYNSVIDFDDEDDELELL